MSDALEWVLAGGATLAVASLAAVLLFRRHRRRAASGQNYEEWLAQTTRLLARANSHTDAAESGVQIYLGPAIRVLDADSEWARRAVEHGHLAWAFGIQFVKLAEPVDDDV